MKNKQKILLLLNKNLLIFYSNKMNKFLKIIKSRNNKIYNKDNNNNKKKKSQKNYNYKTNNKNQKNNKS